MVSTYRTSAMHQPSETTYPRDDRYSIHSPARSAQATTLRSVLELQTSHIQIELSTLPHHTHIEKINAQKDRPPESAVNWKLVNKNRYPHTSAGHQELMEPPQEEERQTLPPSPASVTLQHQS